jgi:hypothetical protein
MNKKPTLRQRGKEILPTQKNLSRDLKNANKLSSGLGTMIDDAITEERDSSGSENAYNYDPLDEVSLYKSSL